MVSPEEKQETDTAEESTESGKPILFVEDNGINQLKIINNRRSRQFPLPKTTLL